MDDWIDYYDSTHTIYASKRHRDVHFETIAADIIGYIPSRDAVVLDYACGEALSAPKVAEACGKLILAEPAPGVRTIRLVPAAGTRLAPYAPGSHVEVECGDVRNAYSLIGDPRDTASYAISVLRCEDGSGGSRYLHDAVSRGDVLRVSAPKSAFAPPASARRHLLVAAGIGITPFLSYARSFARTGADWALHYVHRADQESGRHLPELAVNPPSENKLAERRHHEHGERGIADQLAET